MDIGVQVAARKHPKNPSMPGGQHRVPRASITRTRPIGATEPNGAITQEFQAGAAPLTSIITMTAEVPTLDDPRQGALATVPILTVPVDRWNVVTANERLSTLIQLLQDRGGNWLAKNTSAVVEWTVGPVDVTAATSGDDDQRQPPWVRVDFRFLGAWNGRFSLAAQAEPLADSLWYLAASPIVGIIPAEVADRAIPIGHRTGSVPWRQFTENLDNCLHIRTQPSEAIKRLVVAAGWPGALKLMTDGGGSDLE